MSNQEQLQSDVRDLLNQVMVKLKDVKAYGVEGTTNLSYEDYYANKPEAWLSCVKSIVGHTLEDSARDLARGEELYYSSMCLDY